MRKISEFIMRREKIKKIEEKSKKIMQKTNTKKRFTGERRREKSFSGKTYSSGAVWL
jgi:hypothetical protein